MHPKTHIFVTTHCHMVALLHTHTYIHTTNTYILITRSHAQVQDIYMATRLSYLDLQVSNLLARFVSLLLCLHRLHNGYQDRQTTDRQTRQISSSVTTDTKTDRQQTDRLVRYHPLVATSASHYIKTDSRQTDSSGIILCYKGYKDRQTSDRQTSDRHIRYLVLKIIHMVIRQVTQHIFALYVRYTCT